MAKDDNTHIAEEMYKRNLELHERNKMLALLRKIDQIILSSLNKVEQIADQVTHEIILESKIKSVFIYLANHSNGTIDPLSVAFKKEPEVTDDILHLFYSEKIFYSDKDNPLIKSFVQKKVIYENRMSNIYTQINADIVNETQNKMQIKDFIIQPFYIRQEVAGLVVFGVGEAEITFEYWKDFIFRLPEVISIAINNAFLYQKLEESNEKLRQLDKLKDEFVSVASHELRSPMTAIKNYLWLAMNKKNIDQQETGKYLEIAYQSTDRLLKLVEDMLTISRIEGKRLALQMEKINLNELIESVYSELSVNSKNKNIDTKFGIDESIYYVNGDKIKLREVIQNILSNAIKFTPDNGKITVNMFAKGSYNIIEIFNSGTYISPEDISKLFEKFRRVNQNSDKLDKEDIQGTGLGLYISKQIVELHEGRIEVKSEINQGTSFFIYLKSFIEKSELEAKK